MGKMSVSYLTREGFEKLQQELEYLRTEKRQEVAERLHNAMEDGDAGIDNDVEVEAAKNEQAFVEGRIRELEALLANVEVVERSNQGEVIQIGTTVTIQEDGMEKEIYTIVGTAETDPRNGRISYESPLGKALMDHREGDVVEVNAPNGSFTIKILKVE
ncbi:MAG TPA: transcription elongation factor GreA [Anaerolineae bacterium]|nr:transcription elongation factor GreA [Anaerolineae bacterium]